MSYPSRAMFVTLTGTCTKVLPIISIYRQKSVRPVSYDFVRTRYVYLGEAMIFGRRGTPPPFHHNCTRNHASSRIHLALRSEHFRAMLFGGMRESEAGTEIEIKVCRHGYGPVLIFFFSFGFWLYYFLFLFLWCNLFLFVLFVLRTYILYFEVDNSSNSDRCSVGFPSGLRRIAIERLEQGKIMTRIFAYSGWTTDSPHMALVWRYRDFFCICCFVE